MSQTSENERVEQTWSGWSKFGVGGANLEWVERMWAEQCGEYLDNFEKTLLCKVLFSWAKCFKLDTYICWFSCEI